MLVLDEEECEEGTCKGNSQIMPSEDRAETTLAQSCKANGTRLSELRKNCGKASKYHNSKGEKYINHDIITHYHSRSSTCG